MRPSEWDENKVVGVRHVFSLINQEGNVVLRILKIFNLLVLWVLFLLNRILFVYFYLLIDSFINWLEADSKWHIHAARITRQVKILIF